jgi:polyhydroxybutyrate depolymerase
VADSDAGQVTATNVPGQNHQQPTVEGITRDFFVYVPEKARGTTPVPVVFAVHGTGGNGADFAAKAGWNATADAEGFIVVYPSALTYCHYDDDNHNGTFDEPAERVVVTKWAAGKLGDPARRPVCAATVLAQLPDEQRARADHPMKDDVGFFRFMLDYLTTTHAVDAKRIYVTGFSNGGEMSSRLAAEVSDRFAAGAASGGTLSFRPTAPPPRAMSFVFTIGDRDPLWMPGFIASAPGITSLPLSSDALTKVPSLHTACVQPYLLLGQLDNEATYAEPTVAGKKVSTFTFGKSQVGASNTFRLAIFEDLAHAYPNGENHPARLADLLWTFFKDQQLP